MKESKLPLVSVAIPTFNRKQKLIRLLKSILQSDYPRLEIIIIDDASKDGTYEECVKFFRNIKFKYNNLTNIKILRNEKEKLVSYCRNLGSKNANGEYIFFIDDDNVIDPKCIHELVKTMESDDSIGICAPIMYYLEQPNRVWCAGEKRNMFTSISMSIGQGEINNGQFPILIDCDYVGNAFMIRRKIAKLIRFDDKNFPFNHEDIDYCFKVKCLGYRVVCNTRAKVWHDVPVEYSSFLEKTNMQTEMKAYFYGRNMILFHRKYNNYLQLLTLVLFLPIIVMHRCLKLLHSRNIKIAKSYLLGVVDGLLLMLKI